MIDDHTMSGVNELVIVHESPKPHGPDVIAGMLLTCMRKFPGVELRGRAYDHRSAYRQLPVHLESLKHSYVAHWNEQARAVEIDQLLALKVRGLSLCLRFPQGSYLSVVDWLHVFFVFPHLFGRTKSPTASTYRVRRKGANTRASSGSLAAAKHRELPAHIGQDLVQLRRVPGEIALPRKREFQQRRGDGALRSECQQARAPSNPSCARSSPEWQRHL